MIILGLTGGFHFGSCDAAATILKNGVVLASVEEERISRVKNSFSIPPTRCIKSALEVAEITIQEVDAVALYTEGYSASVTEMEEHLVSLFGYCPPLKQVHHHLCHAASSYYAAGWDEATVVTFDWSGDGVSSSIWLGKGGQLKKIEFVPRPNSLGIFYAAFTQFLGFERGDEYKVMGLAAYGEPVVNLDRSMDVSGDIYQLNTEILNTNNRNLHQLVINDVLLDWYPEYCRPRYAKIEGKHMDMASSVQHQFEQAVFKFVKYAVRLTGSRDVCLAGGSALNCTANGKLKQHGLADRVFVPPFPNDTGCSFGAAAVVAAQNGENVAPLTTAQLGPSFSNESIAQDLDLLNCKATYVDDIAGAAAKEISSGKLLGWFQGRLEVGPRALGGRSILADPRNPSVKERINKFIKFREDFRPFAPSVLEKASEKYFDFDQPSPFMNFIATVKTPDVLPGITHVDGTARLQTVSEQQGIYADLLCATEELSGHPVVLNTSFNYMGQPIVCTPKEAIYTFFGTGLDVMAIGNWLVRKS